VQVFISYSGESRDMVKALVEDLQAFEHDPWFDQVLTGGHTWWSTVLEQILTCDLFIFALSPESLDSHACKLEYTYASGLQKRILPIMVSDGVSPNLLPPALSKIQYLDYRRVERASTLALLKVLDALPEAEPLPDEKPEAPEVPISYLGELKDRIESRDPMDGQTQAMLVLRLKQQLSNEKEAADVRLLLRTLRKRSDLLATVAAEIDALTGSPAARSEPRPRVSKPPPQNRSTPGVAPAEVEVDIVEKSKTYVRLVVAKHIVEGRVDWGGLRTVVTYDDQVVSTRFWILRIYLFSDTHSFVKDENAKPVNYEVRMNAMGGFRIKRNDKVIFSNGILDNLLS